MSRPEVLGEATGDELLGIGRAWKSLETWSFTGKLAVVRELIRRYPLNEDDEPGAAAGGLPDEWDPRLHHEVAAALGISVVAAGKLVNLAWTLDCPAAWHRRRPLEEDRLDPARVQMIVDETSVLDREDLFARAEAIILAGLDRCKTWSDLQRLVQRAVITVDPRRRAQAPRAGRAGARADPVLAGGARGPARCAAPACRPIRRSPRPRTSRPARWSTRRCRFGGRWTSCASWPTST